MKKQPIKIAKYSTGVLVASMALGVQALAQTSDPVLNVLIKKGVLTEAEAKQVLSEVETQKAQEQKKLETTKPSPWVLPFGKESHLRLGGFIQGQGEFGDVESWRGKFSDKPGATADRFRLRRARINVSGDFLEHFDFKMEGDFSNSDGINNGRTAFSGTDIYLNYNKFPEANLRFGQYKAPFGLEQLTPDTTMFTIERSLPTEALTPERQIGLQLSGKPLARVLENKELIEYSFGIFNGNGRNTTVNDNNDFMYAARLTTTPVNGTLMGWPLKWKIGGDGYYNRYSKGTTISPTGNLLMASDGSLSTFNVAPNGDARVWAWGVDQTLTFGPFDLIAEYLENKVSGTDFSTVTAAGRGDFVANGYYVQGSYYLPGEIFPGRWQLVAKWESFNPGQIQYFSTRRGNDDIRSITGGINYYIKGDSLKLMLDYIHTWDDLRHDNSGLGKSEFSTVIARAQVMF